MKLNRRFLFAATTAVAVLGLIPAAGAQDTIKIGEINSYSGMPGFTQPYRKGWEMALEEINKSGGVLGKKLEVVVRDDGGKPGDAVKIAEDMVVKDKVVMVGGTALHGGLFYIGHEILGIYDLVVLIGAAFLVAIATYTSHRWYTFHPRHDAA